MWRTSGLIGWLLLTWTGQSFATELVADLITEFQTGITSIQTHVSAVQSVIQTAKWVLDQTPLEGLVMGGDLMGDVETLNALLVDSEGLAFDLGQVNVLLKTTFSFANVASNTWYFQEHQAAALRYIYDGYAYAMKTQTLLQTTLHTVRHIVRIYAQITKILGTVSGEQVLGQGIDKLVQLQAEVKTSTEAIDRAKSLEGINGPLIEEHLNRINAKTMETYPR